MKLEEIGEREVCYQAMAQHISVGKRCGFIIFPNE